MSVSSSTPQLRLVWISLVIGISTSALLGIRIVGAHFLCPNTISVFYVDLPIAVAMLISSCLAPLLAACTKTTPGAKADLCIWQAAVGLAGTWLIVCVLFGFINSILCVIAGNWSMQSLDEKSDFVQCKAPINKEPFACLLSGLFKSESDPFRICNTNITDLIAFYRSDAARLEQIQVNDGIVAYSVSAGWAIFTLFMAVTLALFFRGFSTSGMGNTAEDGISEAQPRPD